MTDGFVFIYILSDHSSWSIVGWIVSGQCFVLFLCVFLLSLLCCFWIELVVSYFVVRYESSTRVKILFIQATALLVERPNRFTFGESSSSLTLVSSSHRVHKGGVVVTVIVVTGGKWGWYHNHSTRRLLLLPGLCHTLTVQRRWQMEVKGHSHSYYFQ